MIILPCSQAINLEFTKTFTIIIHYNYFSCFPLEILKNLFWVQFSSVQSLRHVWLFAIPWTAAYLLPCLSPTPGACSISCPSSQWCYPAISSSVVPVSTCLQSFPASGSFPMSQFFASNGQSIGASASASVLPMNIQDWFPLRLTGLISLQSKGFSRVFSKTTVQKHQLFGTQFSIGANSHIVHQALCLSDLVH